MIDNLRLSQDSDPGVTEDSTLLPVNEREPREFKPAGPIYMEETKPPLIF